MTIVAGHEANGRLQVWALERDVPTAIIASETAKMRCGSLDGLMCDPFQPGIFWRDLLCNVCTLLMAIARDERLVLSDSWPRLLHV
jgi:hypothetical protein